MLVESLISKLYKCLLQSPRLLVNLAGSDGGRRKVVSALARHTRGSNQLHCLDGRSHGYADVVEAVKAVARCQGKTVLIIDNWSPAMVASGNEASFRRCIGQLNGARHTLVLGTRKPLGSMLDERGRKLFPPQQLGNLKVIRLGGAGGDGGEKQSSDTGSKKAVGAAAAVGLGVGFAALGRMVGRKWKKRGAKKRKKTSKGNKRNGLRTGRDTGDKNSNAADKSQSSRASAKKSGTGENGEISGCDLAWELVELRSKEDAKPMLKRLLQIGVARHRAFIFVKNAIRFRMKLDWLDDDDLYELLMLNSPDLIDYRKKEWEELSDFALNALRWQEFLHILAGHAPQVVEESEAVGFDLSKKDENFLGLHLKRIGVEPEEFAAGLFRASDLRRLFPGFRPEEDQGEFLQRQFKRWRENESIEIRREPRGYPTTSRPRPASEAVDPVEPVELRACSDEDGQRPVRNLYRLLVELDGKSDLESNLKGIEDYQSLKGPTDARFCEWVYARMEERELLDRLAGSVLRSSDEKKLREELGLPPESRHNSWPDSLREVLKEIGVYEPEIPSAIDTGEAKLRKAHEYFSDPGSFDEQTYSEADGLRDARQGLEKMQQVMATFLWQGGLSAEISDVVTEGLHGFDPDKSGILPDVESLEPSDPRILDTLKSSTAGPLNHLLRALSKECDNRGVQPPFLRTEELELWPERLFQRIKSLLDPLNKLMHQDLKLSKRDRQQYREQIPKRLQKVVKALKDDLLRVPRCVQFFRKSDDGHGLHFEGYTGDGEYISFYEAHQDYELHRPYLFLAATNPDAVDMTCVSYSEVFEDDIQ